MLSEETDRNLVIESYVKNSRTPTFAMLAQVREDKDCLIGENKRDPYRFRLALTRDMGVARKTGRKTQGFIDSVLALIADFYGTVVQNLTPWTPKAPKISRSEPEPEPDTAPDRDEMQRVPPSSDDPDADTSGPKLGGGEGSAGPDAPQEPAPVDADPWHRVRGGSMP